MEYRMASDRDIDLLVRSRLETLRAGHRALAGGADIWLVETGDDSVLGIGRYYKGEKLVGLFNFGSERKRISFDELGNFRDLFTGEQVLKEKVIINPGDFVWMLCDFRKELI